MKTLVVFGATSEIAHECSSQFVTRHNVSRVLLIARNGKELARCASDLRVKLKVDVSTLCLDLAEASSYKHLGDRLRELGAISYALIAQGVLTDQTTLSTDQLALQNEVAVNCFSVAACLESLTSEHSATNSHLAVGVFGSVAGDRSRRKNYSYGATKRFVEAYVQGMQHRFATSENLSFTLIKPGPTKTKMTLTHQGHSKMADPASVARISVAAIVSRRRTVYAPKLWFAIMLVIRTIPRSIFRLINF
jgi:short-subunit dehydrogenase